MNRKRRLNAVNDEELIRAYLAAHYLPLDREDLRLRVGHRARAVEIQEPRVGSFCLITACNPSSRMLTDAENERLQAQLTSHLRARGKRWIDATGCDATRSWTEPSLLVGDLGLDDADALACRFDQNAILHWQRGRAVRLRLYGARWETALRTARVDTRFVESVACAPP